MSDRVRVKLREKQKVTWILVLCVDIVCSVARERPAFVDVLLASLVRCVSENEDADRDTNLWTATQTPHAQPAGCRLGPGPGASAVSPVCPTASPAVRETHTIFFRFHRDTCAVSYTVYSLHLTQHADILAQGYCDVNRYVKLVETVT